MDPWLRYAIVVAVGCHGFIYVPFGFLGVPMLDGWHRKPILLGWLIPVHALKILATMLYVAAGGALLAAVAAFLFVPQSPEMQRQLVVVGASVGMTAFVVLYDGRTRFLLREGVVGFLASLALLFGALASPQALG
jgi:hypothetical protein